VRCDISVSNRITIHLV